VHSSPDQDLTRLLADLRAGASGAADRLFPVIYAELHEIAMRLIASRRPGRTLQPTMLVHDVFMRLAQQTDTAWESREHYLAVAAKAMRDLLVDQARRRRAEKRGGGWNRVTLAGLGDGEADQGVINVLDLEDALRRLGEVDPRQERIVELRFFAGLSVDEVARVLRISRRTVLYDWRMARAWLRDYLEDGGR
jgi:RNA polymerase sigma factor (TIGR02999 family)